MVEGGYIWHRNQTWFPLRDTGFHHFRLSILSHNPDNPLELVYPFSHGSLLVQDLSFDKIQEILLWNLQDGEFLLSEIKALNNVL